MKKLVLIAGACLSLTFAGANVAWADDCSGRSHDTGTALGAVGGAAIGGLASHSVGGAVAGGVVGGLAGNAIDRGQDCSKQAENNDRARQAYNNGYEDRAADEATTPDADDRARQAYNNGYEDRAAQEPASPQDDVTVYREPGEE
jgi:uncharacterized protein YcfJ